MRRSFVAPFVLALLSAVVVHGAPLQSEAVENPVEGDRQAIEQGRNIYRDRCGACHGLDGLGYRGPDLKNGPWIHGDGNAELFRIISKGIPGTEMTPGPRQDDRVWMVIAYLRSLRSDGTSQEEERGDPAAGERLFRGKGLCTTCHFVDGRGGRLGPDLSRIGAARSRVALIREIRTTSEYLPPGYEPVTVVTRDGRRILGARKNEDTFSIQLMNMNQELQMFLKRDVVEVIDEEQSLMPEYGTDELSEGELDDLLGYLRTLRGAPISANE